jgi:hypothetical protein
MNETATICDAIRQHAQLEFDYFNKRRIVEPYCHGTSTAGAEVLRAIQVGGDGSGFGFGKLWKLSDMSNLQLGKHFSPKDPNYNPDDSAMKVIHCRI